MRRSCLLLLPLLAACSHLSAPGASTSTVWGPQAVWNGDTGPCRAAPTPDPGQCLLQRMRATGASTQAIAAAGWLQRDGQAGHVSAWASRDGIGIATVSYPFRANTTTATVLVDSTGEAIAVDADPLPAAAPRPPALAALLAAHPDSFAVAPGQLEASEALADGGRRLRYRFALRRCRACDDDGWLLVGHDFDAARAYRGYRLLGVAPAGTAR